MPWYSVNTVMIINELDYKKTNVKQVWLADDAVGAGNLKNLDRWYKQLIDIGKTHGYFVNEDKCWLVVKSQESAERAKQIFGNSVNITCEGKRHLGS